MDKNLLLELNSKKIGLDVKGGEINYISHAHSDHSYALKDNAPIFCSDITASMLGLDYNGKESGEKSSEKKYPPQRIPAPKNFSLHNAGHILGSTQLCADTAEFGKFAYTGDFKLRDGLTVKKGEIIECDTLVMECTYGNPQVSFPPPQEVYGKMQKWSKQNKHSIQLWGGYATGKAQELVKFLNSYIGEAPVVSAKIAQICAHYKNNGIPLEYVSANTPEAQEMMRSPFCAVFAPHQLNNSFASQLSIAHRRAAKVAIATGWAGIRRISAHALFPLSDHADFAQILKYAKESGAKKVYLAHGKNESTAKALQKEGINAFAIDEIGKTNETGKTANEPSKTANATGKTANEPSKTANATGKTANETGKTKEMQAILQQSQN